MEEENKNNDQIEFRWGNKRFGGSYRPGEFELNLPPELSREEFEEMFRSKMQSLHKFKQDIEDEYFTEETECKKEKLKPLSIRVKPHTKEFFKNLSILTAREVLELYEDYNNGSEAFINSLLEDEKQLKEELDEIQEKLHNAKLFKEKLKDLKPQTDAKTDDKKLEDLKEEFSDSKIKVMDKQSTSKEILDDLQIYNVKEVFACPYEYLKITVGNDTVPVIYYFKNECSDEDFDEISSEITEYCNENDIEFKESDE